MGQERALRVKMDSSRRGTLLGVLFERDLNPEGSLSPILL